MRKKEKKTLDQKVEEVLEIMDVKEISRLFDDLYQLLELYHVTPEDDWVRDRLGGSNVDESVVSDVRLLRTVYMLSKIADKHAGNLCKISWQFKGLYIEMENQVKNKDFKDE